MAGNGKSLREALTETLTVEPALSRAELEIHASGRDGDAEHLRERMKELLDDAPVRSRNDGYLGQDLDAGVLKTLRAAFEESLGENATLAESEMQTLADLGLEKLGEFRTAIQGHLASDAELADRDLAIYVKAGGGRKTAFQRALEENLKDLAEHPPEEKTLPEAWVTADLGPPESVEEAARGAEQIEAGNGFADEPAIESTSETPWKRALTIGSGREISTESVTPSDTAPSGELPGAGVPRMEPIPLLTAALEAVGFAEDEFGFVLRYGRYAQPGRSSEFLVGGVGLSDLSERLTGWLEAQGANDCEVQVLDDGSGELMIYLLGHDQPIPSPGTGPLAEQG
jgi:hypothetical protein